jgi:type IV secretory pathway ATPase VirB11/archaellum biosynthesis ATPase
VRYVEAGANGAAGKCSQRTYVGEVRAHPQPLRHNVPARHLVPLDVRPSLGAFAKRSERAYGLSAVRSPVVDAMLPDGSRLHVVIPDITRQHWSVNIRKFVLSANSLDELITLGTITPQAARFLEAAIVAGLNVIVAGGTQAVGSQRVAA